MYIRTQCALAVGVSEEDVIDIPDWDEERVVEEFAEYMMDETLYSRLVDDVIMEYLEYEE